MCIRDRVTAGAAAARGWGVYDVALTAWGPNTGTSPYTAYGGILQRGQLTMYDPGLFYRHNAAFFNATNTEGIVGRFDQQDHANSVFYTPAEETVAALPDDGARHGTFISFLQAKTLAEAADFMDSVGSADWWLAVKVQGELQSKREDETIGVMGLRVNNYPYLYDFLQYTDPDYPLMRPTKTGADRQGISYEANTLYTDEAALAKQMTQSLQYLQKQTRFLAMMEEDPADLAAAEAYIAENGLSIHGCFVWADKTMLQTIAEAPDVSFATLDNVAGNRTLTLTITR